jgi:hypothetical protein
VPRTAGPGPGRARSPLKQITEQMFETESRMLRTATAPLTACLGRAGAADGRNPGDSKGQQETTKLQVTAHGSGSRDCQVLCLEEDEELLYDQVAFAATP